MADRIDNDTDKTNKELAEILHRVDQLPELDPRSPEEIIGYDEDGLPAHSMAVGDTTDSCKGS